MWPWKHIRIARKVVHGLTGKVEKHVDFRMKESGRITFSFVLKSRKRQPNRDDFGLGNDMA